MRETPIRRKVLAAFDGSKKPLSIKEALVKLPGLDTVTMYRAVEALEKAGKLNRVDLGTRAAAYEGVGHHHHHIVCTACGRIEDFESCDLAKAELAALADSKYFSNINRHSFELFGICDSCAKTAPLSHRS